jgi:hypothetical protein
MLAGLLVSHLSLLRSNADSCALQGELLRERFSKTNITSPESSKAAARIHQNLKDCRSVEQRFSEASQGYQATVLALLGGAGMAAGAMSSSGQQRRGTRRTDADGVPSVTLRAALGDDGERREKGDKGDPGEPEEPPDEPIKKADPKADLEVPTPSE